MDRPVYVAVVGSGGATGELYKKAREVGRLVASRGDIVVCGGLSGVMEGCGARRERGGGVAIGILPDEDQPKAGQPLRLVLPPYGHGPGPQPRGHLFGERGRPRRRLVRDALGDRTGPED